MLSLQSKGIHLGACYNTFFFSDQKWRLQQSLALCFSNTSVLLTYNEHHSLNLFRTRLDKDIRFYNNIWVEVMCLLCIESLNSVFVSLCFVCMASQVSASWRSSRKLQRRSRNSGTLGWKQPEILHHWLQTCAVIWL